MILTTLKKTIAILIPVHNGLELTKKCLEDLHGNLKSAASEWVEFIPVIVDDGSTDSTAQWIQSNCVSCILLKGDGNLWWSGAVNLGARYAIHSLQADYILLWNNDIQVLPDYFSILTDIIAKMDHNSIIGSTIYADPQYQKIWSAGGIFNPYTGDKYMMVQHATDITHHQQVTEVDWLTGMGTLIPSEVVERIGYWDAKRFPQYYGDSDFTYRAKLSGTKILVYPQLRIVNDLSNSGIKKVTRFREIIPTLTNIKSIHHIGKNFMFYWLYSKSPRAYLKFLEIYVYFFGGFAKRIIMGLFNNAKKTK
jgi:GT2 family glycosyltransferase